MTEGDARIAEIASRHERYGRVFGKNSQWYGDVLWLLASLADAIRQQDDARAQLAEEQAVVDAFRKLSGLQVADHADAMRQLEEARALAVRYQLLAANFIAYWTQLPHRLDGGCGMCGGVPHSETCFVGRFAALSGGSPSSSPHV